MGTLMAYSRCTGETLTAILYTERQKNSLKRLKRLKQDGLGEHHQRLAILRSSGRILKGPWSDSGLTSKRRRRKMAITAASFYFVRAFIVVKEMVGVTSIPPGRDPEDSYLSLS